MRVFFFLFLVSFFFRCSDSIDIDDKSSSTEEVKFDRIKPISVNVYKWRLERINADSVRIDGTIPIVASKDEIINKFGQPTRINQVSPKRNYMVSDGDKAYEWEYGGTVFDLVDGKLTLKILDFSSTDVTLVVDSLTLRKGMLGTDVCELFPESRKLLIPDGGSMWSGHLTLRSGRNDPYRRWILVFKGEKLAKIYYCLTY